MNKRCVSPESADSRNIPQSSCTQIQHNIPDHYFIWKLSVATPNVAEVQNDDS